VTSEGARARLEAARERHRERSVLTRTLAVAGGGLAGLTGAVLVLPVPELGLPLLLVGLRLLALEYEWATRAYLPVARLWDRVKALSLAWKIAIAIAAIVVLAIAGLLWWLARGSLYAICENRMTVTMSSSLTSRLYS